MNLLFLVVCLTSVLLTLEHLIIRGFHTKSHRLLPLILGLFALYDFYLIVEYLVGDTVTITILKELLLVNLLAVLFYYVLDFIRLTLDIKHNLAVTSAVILMDVMIFTQFNKPDNYRKFIVAFCVVSTMSIIALSVFFQRKARISLQTKKNNEMVLLTFVIPGMSLIACQMGLLKESVFMPIALGVSCIILNYLLITDRLSDIDSVIKEEFFQTLDSPAILFDKDLFFLDASRKARELFADQIKEVEKNPAKFAFQDDLRAMIAQDGVLHRVIGGRYYKSVIQSVIYNGREVGYFLTFFDITEQKNETNVAKEIARQKSEFLASMSHDLRSPLHAIIGSSEIALSRVEMSERIRVLVGHIHKAGKNLLDLVNSILDFSKLEDGNLKLHPTTYNFKSMVDEQARVAYANLNKKPVKFTIEVQNPFPENMYGDELRVRQIIQNLISNAIKFTDSGFVKAIFNISIEKDYRVKIHFDVVDSGIGMSYEQTKTVFSNYVTYAQENKKEGTGLGLSIVRLLAEMMGGYAFAVSDGKTGSRVTAVFYQNLTDDDKNQMENKGINLSNAYLIEDERQLKSEEGWKNTNVPSYIYPRAKVLIVDDMEVNLKIFKEISSPWKIQLDTAKNGEEAVKKVSENKYDMIFLDQMMPIMSGTEAADEIRKITNVPMVLLTADITERMRNESIKHGFVEFMQKPIDIALLKQNLETYLPEELRDRYEEEQNIKSSSDTLSDDAYKKALSIYISELKELYKVLPEYLKSDIDMFRNKVHGIKGVSRQLDKKNIALLAEIMEMAAIIENREFLEDYMDAFMSDLDFVISSSEEELASLNSIVEVMEENAEEDSIIREVSSDELVELFRTLSESLEEYEMNDIEDTIEQIKAIALEETVSERFKKVVELYEDMEYEEALSTVNEILAGM